MSVEVDRSVPDALNATGAALSVADLPVSVSCWVYFDSIPGQGETHAVWWWGVDGDDGRAISLSAIAGSTGITFKARVAFQNTSITVTSAGEYDTGAWHCISVVVEESQPGTYRAKLYVDGEHG